MGTSFEESVEREVSRILLDPAFKRAPVQSTLLKFLAQQSCKGTAEQLTQYDIGVSGLGKHENFDETQDSSVRVQISRLRASLASYYSRNEPIDEGCIYIRPGDYKLRIGSRQIAYPNLRQFPAPENSMAIEDKRPETWSAAFVDRAKRLFAGESAQRRRPAFAVGAISMASVFAIMAFPLFPQGEVEKFNLTAIDRPFVGYQVERVGFARGDDRFSELEDATSATIESILSRSITTHLSEERANSHPPYTIRVLFNLDADGTRFADLRLDDQENRTIHQERRPLPSENHAAVEALREEVAAIFAPPGVLARHMARSIPRHPRSAFECMLLIEVGPPKGTTRAELVETCARNYAGSEYTPFIEARSLFWAFQKEVLHNGRVSNETAHWQRVRDLLGSHPNNPYLNTLAAKALFGRGECREAYPYADALSDHGKQYPALELMIATEISGCELTPSEREYWADRVRSVVQANREPHAMLQLYELAALIAYDQVDTIAQIPSNPFTQADSQATGALIGRLRDAAINRTPLSPDSGVEAVVWNREARIRLVDVLRTRSLASDSVESPNRGTIGSI